MGITHLLLFRKHSEHHRSFHHIDHLYEAKQPSRFLFPQVEPLAQHCYRLVMAYTLTCRFVISWFNLTREKYNLVAEFQIISSVYSFCLNQANILANIYSISESSEQTSTSVSPNTTLSHCQELNILQLLISFRKMLSRAASRQLRHKSSAP